MSVQSEIKRIKDNVANTLQTIADTGVTVGEGSDALPAAAQALANEKLGKDEAAQTYLPLAGGEMTGAITGRDSEGFIVKTQDLTSGEIRVVRGLATNGASPILVAQKLVNEQVTRRTQVTVTVDDIQIQSRDVDTRQESLIAVQPDVIGIVSPAIQMTGIVTPTTDTMPTSKSYVDTAIQSAIQNTWEASY